MKRISKIIKSPFGIGVISSLVGSVIFSISVFIWGLITNASFIESICMILSFLNTPISIPLYFAIILEVLLIIVLFKKKNSYNQRFLDKKESFPVELVEDSFNEEIKSHPDKHSENSEYNLEVITEAPTVFFFNRVSDAFAGIEGFKWIDDPYKAIERLLVLLKPPIVFDKSDGFGVVKQPIWLFQGAANRALKKCKRIIDEKHILLDYREINVKRIGVFRGASYYTDFVYVEANADKSVFEVNEEIIKEYENESKEYRIEYALFNNMPITRQEYDDGIADIRGKLISLDGKAELRGRSLTPYNFIITSKHSPINSNKYDRKMEEILQGMLKKKLEIENLIEFIESLPRHKNDN